jgi:hypothetical protein
VPRASIYAAMVLGCTIVGILGATVGHMARLGIEQQPFERPQLTVSKTYRAGLREDARATAVRRHKAEAPYQLNIAARGDTA